MSVEQRLTAAELYRPEQREQLAALLEQQHALSAQIKQVESDWLQAQERLEAMERN